MAAMSKSLADLLAPDRITSVVDIGANPIDGTPPYKPMLEKRLCRLIGFEPQLDALAELNSKKSDLETYLMRFRMARNIPCVFAVFPA